MNRSDWSFYLDNAAALREEIDRLGVDVPLAESRGAMGKPIRLRRCRIPNRWCAQPISGNDARSDGAPSALTLRRYTRLAEGGFGLLWVEAALASRPAQPRPGRLVLAADTQESFAAFAQAVRSAARRAGRPNPALILQLVAEAGASEPLPDDDALDRAGAGLEAAAALAAGAGFDGIDLSAASGDLPARLLEAFGRPGRYGGPLDQRARFLLDAVSRLRSRQPDCLIGVRLNAYAARADPRGFGVSAGDYRRPDPDEPTRLARMLRDAGADILNVTANSPNLRAPPDQRARHPFADADLGDEHPLTTLSRNLALVRALREAAGGLAVVAGGWTWLRNYLPAAAAGALEAGAADFAGVGRPGLAYPDLPAAAARNDFLDPVRCCRLCQSCRVLSRRGGRVGCVLQDAAVYGPEYRLVQRFAEDRLMSEAQRCHACYAPPCCQNAPGNLDIPGFIRAFEQGRHGEAFARIRKANLLPEASAAVALGPPQKTGESLCIETILSGRPVAIRDLMTAVSRHAREQGWTGVRIPPGPPSGRRVAVVGGGVAGISAAARLVEYGHAVTLFERRSRLGGVPELLIPADRFPGAGPEIDALLAPALQAGRLDLRLGVEWGRAPLTLSAARREFDAVLLSAGMWRNRSLGRAPGVVDAAVFLELVKAGSWMAPLADVALLAGGDCAMDSSATALRLGARNLYVVFPGPRADLLWCMEESFFSRPAVHAMMLTRPLGYVTGAGGRVAGLRVRPRAAAPGGAIQDLTRRPYTLPVGTVIEAGGLEPDTLLRRALRGLPFDARGLLALRGPGTFATPLDGVYAAGALINGGASVPQCAAEGLDAAKEINARWAEAP